MATGDSRTSKSASAFRTISEVAKELDLPQHVLRFWESKFTQIKPLKRAGGRRYYRPEDVSALKRIRSLLYDEGYTIKGVQKILHKKSSGGDETAETPTTPAEVSAQASQAPSSPAGAPASHGSDKTHTAIKTAIAELQTVQDALAKVMA